MDIIVTALMSQVSIQLDMLSDSILHIKEFAEMRLRKTEIHSDLENEMKSFFVDCVKHHLQLKE